MSLFKWHVTLEDPTALIFVIKVMFNHRILSLVFKIDCADAPPQNQTAETANEVYRVWWDPF
jgi:hypothetical protein